MPASAPAPEERQQFLSFHLAGEEYGVEILRIREVVEYQRLTPVPTTPEWVRGVMNLRGTVVPVLDLAAKFQQEPTRVEKLTCIVIFEVELEGEPTPVGVMIDRVGRVLELAEGEIQEPPAFGSPVRKDLLEGIGMVDETPIAILNIQKVLTEDELAVAVAGSEDADAEEAPAGAGSPEIPPEPQAPSEAKAPTTATAKAQDKPKATADSKAGTQTGSPPKSKPEAKAGSQSKSKSKSKSKSRSKSKSKSKAKSKSEAKSSSEPDAKSGSGAEKEPDGPAERETEPKAPSKPKDKTENKTGNKTGNKTKPSKTSSGAKGD